MSKNDIEAAAFRHRDFEWNIDILLLSECRMWGSKHPFIFSCSISQICVESIIRLWILWKLVDHCEFWNRFAAGFYQQQLDIRGTTKSGPRNSTKFYNTVISKTVPSSQWSLIKLANYSEIIIYNIWFIPTTFLKSFMLNVVSFNKNPPKHPI